MKLVCSSLDNPFVLERERINVLCIENAELFGRFAHAASLFFSDETQEPARLYSDNDDAVKMEDFVVFVGDILHLDLHDKKISALLLKWLTSSIREHELEEELNQKDFEIRQYLTTLLLQMHGDYAFFEEWDATKYAKAHNLCVDIVETDALSDRVSTFLNIASDFFPTKLLIFVHLRTYMSEDEYGDFVEQCCAQNLCVLLIETGQSPKIHSKEHVLCIDGNFIEKEL